MKIKHLLLSLLFVFGFLTSAATANEHAGATAFKTQEQLIAAEKENYKPQSVTELIGSFFHTTGLDAMINPVDGLKNAHGVEVSTFAQRW
jgi:oxaloacetate decarboxylase beta subunit